MKPTGIFKIVEMKNQHNQVYSLLLTGTKHKINLHESPDEAKKRRVRLRYKPCERDQAKLELVRLTSEASKDEPPLQKLATRLSPSQLTDAENALNLLPSHISLTIAAQSVAHAQPKILDIYLSEMLDKYEVWADVNGTEPKLRSLTVDAVKGACRAFIAQHGDLRTSMIPQFNFLNWRTNYSYIRALSSLFTWGARPDPKHLPYLASNPLRVLLTAMRPAPKRGRPAILAIDSCQRMLDASAFMFDGLLEGPFVLMTWAVARPNETWLTSEEFLALEEGKIWIPPHTAKRHDLGEVDLMPNALYMLERWLSDPRHTFEAAFAGFRKRFDAIKEAGGYIGSACPDWARAVVRDNLLPWIPDLPRHTGLTYHFKITLKKSDTCDWGRTSRTLLARCYVGKTFDRFAVMFWLMLPTGTPRNDRVKVYADTIVKLSGSRLVRALRAYLLEHGIDATLCPEDSRKWDTGVIAECLADALISEEANRLEMIAKLPKLPPKSKIPEKAYLEKIVANKSFVQAGQQFEVSGSTVGRWCVKLGIVRSYQGHHCAPPRRVADDAFKKMCETMTNAEIRKKTGYDRSTVKRRAAELGIRTVRVGVKKRQRQGPTKPTIV